MTIKVGEKYRIRYGLSIGTAKVTRIVQTPTGIRVHYRVRFSLLDWLFNSDLPETFKERVCEAQERDLSEVEVG